MNADAWLTLADEARRTVLCPAVAGRALPPAAQADGALSVQEKSLSVSLMRVNHVGEICAQALYTAQALTAKEAAHRAQLQRASQEETDHLAWTEQRLQQLGGRPSVLAPLWWLGAFGVGCLAGRAGDAISLGFVVETERQVEAHLAGHLDRLPAQDHQSRAIVEQMKADEAEHAHMALEAGGVPLPVPVQWAMKAAAKVMTTVAHRW